MCSHPVELAKQKGHFPEQKEQFWAFAGRWKPGGTELRLCKALSHMERHETGFLGLGFFFLSEGKVSELWSQRSY